MKNENLAKETRETIGFNVSDMSKAMGVHRDTWGKWERGAQRMPNVARRLCFVLKWMHSRGYLEKFLKP